MPHSIQRAVQTLTCVLAVTFVTPVNAQDSMRTGDGLLILKASMPQTARVGEQFTYSVEVTNTSENVVLHDVTLEQHKAKGFTVESVSLQGKQENNDDDSDKASSGHSDDQTTQEQQASQQSLKGKSPSNGNSSSGNKSMKIAKLDPGESRTFMVKASADEEGELRSCLQISSYKPALCLTSEIVKPELELTKIAPQQVSRCTMIELNYKVKNGGSGDVGKFVVTDALGDGLATIEGDRELSFDVDGLAAGETREFVARVYAKKPGTFSSRAVAKAENSELKSRSKETTTKVTAVDLSARVEGPSRVYGNDMATFNASITNTGNAAAESVNVMIHWPSKANLADMSETTMKKADSSKDQGSQGEPTPAKEQDSNNQNKSGKNQNASEDDMQMETESFVIDRLEAGQTAEFNYAIRTDNLDTLPTKVVARYVCTVDAAEDQAKSTGKATAMAMAKVDVVRLPALQIAVVDDEDPVTNESKVQYTVSVWNEGDAPDQNVQIVATLPSNLKFDTADGPTDVKNEGGKITFSPIKSFSPGDRVEYTITATPTGSGNARFEAALTSKMLQQKVIGEEPTRLFDSASK